MIDRAALTLCVHVLTHLNMHGTEEWDSSATEPGEIGRASCRDNEAVLNSATLFPAEMLQGLGNISLVISTNALFILIDMGVGEKRGSSLNLFK